MVNRKRRRASNGSPTEEHLDIPNELKQFLVLNENLEDPLQNELISQHTHLLNGEIGDENIARATQWIIAENLRPLLPNEKRVLTLYINSVGGDLYQTFALVDLMHISKYPIRTIGIGNVMSAATLILACGQRGERYIGKHTGIMMHQFSSGLEGKEHELRAGMKELEFCRKRIHSLLTNYCKISERVVTKQLLQPSDAWVTAEEAVKLKLADKIFTHF